MRILDKGFAITTWGKSSLAITDREGKEIFRTDQREVETEEEVRDFLKKYLKNLNKK